MVRNGPARHEAGAHLRATPASVASRPRCAPLPIRPTANLRTAPRRYAGSLSHVDSPYNRVCPLAFAGGVAIQPRMRRTPGITCEGRGSRYRRGSRQVHPLVRPRRSSTHRPSLTKAPARSPIVRLLAPMLACSATPSRFPGAALQFRPEAAALPQYRGPVDRSRAAKSSAVLLPSDFADRVIDRPAS